MSRRYSIVIAGAGVTGLMLAARLAALPQAERLDVCVVDAAERPPEPEGDDIALRVSALSPGSMRLLQEVGAWQLLAGERICPYDHMRVWDADAPPDGPATLRFDADEFAVAHLGYIVENIGVQLALLGALAPTRTELRFAAGIESLEDANGRRRAALEDGSHIDADLVVAADGAGSSVREAAGIEVETHPYRQTAFVTHLRPGRPHADTAWQRFLPDGPLGILPLADGRVSVVWTTTPAAADNAMQADDAALGSLLTAASDQVLGELSVAGPRGSFPLLAQHAKNYVRQGIALIGDAAHTVHPLAGQGANLGLADAAALAAVIGAALEAREHPGDRPVLRRYERQRRGENAAMMHFLTGLNRLFASDSWLPGELRRTGMALFNRGGPLRKKIIDVALGGRH